MNFEGRGLGNPGKKLRRGGETEAEKITGGGRLGQEESAISRHEIAGRPGEAAHGGLLPGEGNAVRAAQKLPGSVGADGREETDTVRSCGGQIDPGFFGMGLEASAILGDVERIEEGILIAIGALERAIDRLAITRQMAVDMLED